MAVTQPVSLSEVKAQLAGLVHAAEGGEVVHISRHGKPVSAPPRFRDHQLKADWKGYRDYHVFPDLILIYQLKADCILRLARLGSHRELSL